MLGFKGFGHVRALWATLSSWARSIKMIHVIREPVAMAVSAYWYALRMHGADSPSGMKVLGELNMSAGLELNARAMMGRYIGGMVETTIALEGERRQIAIGIEDFGDNWPVVAARISALLFNSSAGPTSLLLASGSPFKVPSSVPNAGVGGGGSSGSHFASGSNTTLAFATIEESDEVVWDDLREARQRIGYQSTSRGWRYIPPSGPRVVPAPRAVYSGRPPYARAVYAKNAP
jgi:hypothetical protein